MNVKIEQFEANNPNPVLGAAMDGTILYSNEAGKPLLNEWGIRVGEKLPSSIVDLVQKVISQNNPEKIEFLVGNRVFLVAFHPISKEESVNIYGFDISDHKEVDGKLEENEDFEIAKIELADIIDVKAVKPLMDDLFKLVQIPIGINDLKGNVLASVGWQEICTKFHRVNLETFKHCVESDTKLSSGVLPGEFKLYKCKNNMYDIVTPIMVCSRHVGYVFSGQFFFDDEPLDYELFRSQARKYGFNEEEYIAALEKAPRLSRETVNTGMSFFMTFANMLSQLNYSNIKLAKSLSEHNALLEALSKSEEKYRNIIETANEGIWVVDTDARATYVNKKMADMLGYSQDEMIGRQIWDFTREDNKISIKKVFEKRRQGIDESFEFEFLRKDGSPLWVLISSKSLFEKDGKFTGTLGMLTDITERKKVEEALRGSEEKFRTLFENSSAAIFVADIASGEIIDCNQNAEKLIGRPHREIIGLHQTQLHPVDKEQHYRKMFANHLHNTVIKNYEAEVQHSDGQVIPILVNATPLKINGRNVMIGVFLDITESKQAEEALKRAHDNLEIKVKERTAELEKAYNSLKESEKSLAEAQKLAHIGNWDWEIATDKACWSDELYNIFGLNPQELAPSYDGYLSYVHPDDRENADKAHKEALNGKAFSMDHRIILANGEERTIHMKTEVIFNEKNNPIRLKGTVQDITERKLAEEKLRESEEKYRNIVETANEGIALVNSEGVITYVNKKMADMLGYAVEEIIERYTWDFVEDKSTATMTLENRRRGVTDSIEIKQIRKDGLPLWVHMNSKPIFDNNGKFMGSLGMFTDITERKKAEEVLGNIEIARKKEIHHRIKNNLQVISSLLDLQAEKFKGRKDIKDLEVLEAFRENQDRVISMALIHEELHKGGETDKVNFSQYIVQLVDNLFLTYKLGDENISLNMNIDEDIFFDMDTSVPLGMIVNELVSNSLKYAFVDRDKGEIRIKLLREESNSSTFTLTVSDNGVGIPENFDVENLDSLGLQLVTALVDQLDGELEVKRDRGTEFIIRFTVSNQASVSQQLVD